MLYKDFIAEAAQKIMAAQVKDIDLAADFSEEEMEKFKERADGCVAAARYLADALEKDFSETPVDGGVKRYAESETFFDNYVNWTKTA